MMNNPEDAELELIYDKLYNDLIQSIDGIDNGVQQYSNYQKENYKDYTGLASRVGLLNGAWNESFDDQDERFLKAVELCGQEFSSRLNYLWR